METKVLGKVTSILGLLGIFLYFTGWIYRWAYFGSFGLELIRLNLPIRSYLFVTIQVFFGNPMALLRTIIGFIVAAIALKLIQDFLHWLQFYNPRTVKKKINLFKYKLKQKTSSQRVHRLINYMILIINRLYSLIDVFLKRLKWLLSVIPITLRNELITVIGLIIILFWLARIQGSLDARRDMIKDSSTLPEVTYLVAKKQLIIGRNPQDPSLIPSLKEYQIIGDLPLLTKLKKQVLNDADASPPRVWLLLLENNNWLYVFPAVSKDAKDNEFPPILAIRQDKEGQIMIINPVKPED